MMSYARRRYYADCINKTSGNPQTLWKTINNIFHKIKSLSISAFFAIKSLSESFSKFFIDKIEKICMNFTNDVHNMLDNQSPTVKSRMTCFEPATADQVRTIIINSPSKTCDLAPIPTELLQSCLDVFLVQITQMVNLSLISGFFPNILKTSHFMPLLEKTSLSNDDMKNYIPESNLNYYHKS